MMNRFKATLLLAGLDPPLYSETLAGGGLLNLFFAHPLMKERIARLESMNVDEIYPARDTSG